MLLGVNYSTGAVFNATPGIPRVRAIKRDESAAPLDPSVSIYIYHVFPKSRKASHGNVWVGHLPASERELP